MALPAVITIPELRDDYLNGRRTPLDVASELMERIKASGRPEIFITLIDEGRLLNQARALNDDLRRDPTLPARMPLFGIPFAVKDNIDVAGMPTTCACPDYAYTPVESAAAVQRLLDAGALVMGKTNLDQFATGLVGTRSPYGEVRNPFNPDYVSGGSSSGSAVAVALGFVAFALGTDTAGSGRIPAGFCNLVGMKPTPGLVSTRGVVPACRSLDCVSVMAHTVEDAWEAMSCMAAPDPGSAYSRNVLPLPVRTRNVRIGIAAPLEFFGDRKAEAAFDASLSVLRNLGECTFRTIPFQPFADVARMLYEGPWVAERRIAVGEFFDRHAGSMDPTVRAVIDTANGRTACDAFNSFYLLEAARHMAQAVFEQIDVLVVPTAPTIYRRSEIAADPITRNSHFGIYTNFVNLLGMCALAMPGTFREDGMPAGITLIAPEGGDHRLASFAQRIEPLLHRQLATTNIKPPRPRGRVLPLPSAEPMARVAVVGAHLTGMPLNWQLVECGGRLIRTVRTAPEYRLFELSGTDIPKPGLVHVSEGGAAIEVEIWQLPERCYGGFVAGIPSPLGIGMLELEDGSEVQGFVCETTAIAEAKDISHYGGWKAYRAAATDSLSQGVSP